MLLNYDSVSHSRLLAYIVMAPTNNEDRRIQRRNLRIRFCILASVVGVLVARLQQLHLLLFNSSYVDKPLAESNDYKDSMRAELLRTLTSSDQICYNILRMHKDAFQRLCEMLRGQNLVKDIKNSIVEKKVARFLYLIAHNVKNRALYFFFHRTLGSISYHFHEVLRVIVSLHNEKRKRRKKREKKRRRRKKRKRRNKRKRRRRT